MSINDGYMMEESLGDFIRRNQVLHIGIYRLVQVPDSIRLSQILDSLIAIPKIFDYDFDMNDDRELYCTELIINVLNKINKDIPFRPASDGILYPPMLLDHHLLTPIINPYEKNDY